MANNIIGIVRQWLGQANERMAAIEAQHAIIEKLCSRAPSITEEIDAIPGRRIMYNLSGEVNFDLTDNGRRGQPVTLLVSQDGSFVQTHYPLVLWRPSLPANATNFGMWRPVSAWPLPAQVRSTSGVFEGDEDLISISYEIEDAGSNRNFQNETAGPLLSRPDYAAPLSVPTLYAPNASVKFFPTYEGMRFSATVPPTQGVLKVTFPGYRIVNL